MSKRREHAEQSPVVPQQDEERPAALESDGLGTASRATAEDVLEEPVDDAPSATEGLGITVEVILDHASCQVAGTCMHATTISR